MDWIINNKEWLFSGIAVAVPLAIIGFFFNKKTKTQVQKGGIGSKNIQVGRNLNIGDNIKND
ncbi:hypothetical protein ACTFQF_14045 [Aliivibrio fischeri]|uniref:hypothetical protein n=1 Tax=Aliivibrio fischeri TaxID=668 RepID=UPI0007C447D9|nr:hypothetical protein [Aliivibrio fischeri]MBP3142213.1 hypothetical protein [Aliivibrio fischeri]MBP3157157.1 hypothetical protein [Aliivibrio fischeri]MCE7575229.1 hypothetical protein [Aliivibrio fischeri]